MTGKGIATYIERVGLCADVLASCVFWEFLEVGKKCFTPEMGRKGKSGYVKKVCIIYRKSNESIYTCTRSALVAMRYGRVWNSSNRGSGGGWWPTTPTLATTPRSTT